MNLKTTLIASALLSLTVLSAHAAKELTPEKAAAIKPFQRITFTGRFNSIKDAVLAASRRADKLNADAFYIQSISDANNGGNWRISADLYQKNAPAADNSNKYRVIAGIKALSKDEAFSLEPFDTVSITGFYPSQPDIDRAIAKEAQKKGAASFYIVRQFDANSGGNQFITAFVYKADAPKRTVQSPDVIPADSEAAKVAIANGEAAKVEIPGVASSASPSRNVGRFFETQSSTGKRYSVTLSSGVKIQELNNATAAKMQPFDSVTFTGHFGNPSEVAREVAKKAAKKGAKYYHITRQWQNKSGGNLTVSADLFK